MTNTIRIRKTDSPNVRNAKRAARAMVEYAHEYVETHDASQLVITDVEKYDAPAIIADGAITQAFAIWILAPGGSQLIRAAGTDLGTTCRMTLDSLRGNRLEVWRVHNADLIQVCIIGATAPREQIEAIGRGLDLLVQAEGCDRAALGHAQALCAAIKERDAQNDWDGYWTRIVDKNAKLMAECHATAEASTRESIDTLKRAVG